MEDQLWQLLLLLKREIAQYNAPITFCHLTLDGTVCVNTFSSYTTSEPSILLTFDRALKPIPQNATVLFPTNKLELDVLAQGKLDNIALQFLEVYLPYCLFPIFAKARKSALTTAHFAQSLDGRIATLNGHSKWIGNEENLIHAHRMRALSDAILIGTGTLTNDQPRLTVRLVPGENPLRVVLGKPVDKKAYSCLETSCSKRILAIGTEKSTLNGQIDYKQLKVSKNGRIDSNQVNKLLFQQGIYSVYLEGGAITTSNFIKDKAVDVLQLHFSPLIFGSGISSIVLPEIEEVRNAIQFDTFQFQKVGDTMMFVGQLT